MDVDRHANPAGPFLPPDLGDEFSRHTRSFISHGDGETHTPDTHPPPASDLPLPFDIDGYRLESELSRGGMGVIYRGWCSTFDRELAVKVLLPAHANKPEFRRRAEAEALITARMVHPGVVPVYALGRLPDGRPYFGMRLVPGVTLAELMDARPDPSADHPRLIKVFEQVCQTLAYAHSRGVVHRDVKPTNVLVAPFGVVKLIDWGVAKVLPGSPLERAGAEAVPDPTADATPGPAADTRHGVVMGTVRYMAPEQVRGDPAVDARADVFALGGLLCHLLTGHPPYVAKSFRKTFAKAQNADLGEAFARLDGCPADRPLVRLAKRCLAADPVGRPLDAGVVAGDLAAYFESDLRQAERDMARFFELTFDLFCIADLHTGRFKRVNANFARVLGHPEEELLRYPFLHFVHPDDRPATQAVMEQMRAGRPVVRFRNRYRDVRGEYRVLEWTAKEETSEGEVFAIAREVNPAEAG